MSLSTSYRRWYVPIPEGDLGPTDVKDKRGQVFTQSRDETGG